MLEEVLARVEQRLKAVGKTPAAASKEAGLSADAIRNMQRAVKGPDNRKGVSTRTIAALAPVLETTVGWLLKAEGDEVVRLDGVHESPAPYLADKPAGDPIDLAKLRAFLQAPKPGVAKKGLIDRRVPVVGEVTAGIWKEVPELQLTDVTDWLALDIQGYERATLSAWKVVGPSMNLVYPPGRFVVTAPPWEAGLRHEDYVVVQRGRSGLYEVTLKELVLEADGRIALWPRSSDEQYQTPFYLSDDPFSQEGAMILGVVVGDYARRERPPVPFSRPERWAE